MLICTLFVYLQNFSRYKSYISTRHFHITVQLYIQTSIRWYVIFLYEYMLKRLTYIHYIFIWSSSKFSTDFHLDTLLIHFSVLYILGYMVADARYTVKEADIFYTHTLLEVNIAKKSMFPIHFILGCSRNLFF